MKKRATQEQINRWAERYLAGETSRAIAQDYDFDEDTISRHMRKLGLSRGRGNQAKYLELKPKVIKEYIENKKITIIDLAKKYNISDRTVSAWLKENNIEIKQSSGMISNCNEEYFDTIDTPNKAYLLGFITADGSVTGKQGYEPRLCSIEVHEKDRDLILFARNEINPLATITECHYGKKNNCRISFSSKKLCTSLSKYGIIPNKSKTIERVPDELIPTNLLPFYFRGLIDGDGCIHKTGAVAIYSGSKSFIESVQEIMVREINIKKLGIYHGTTYFISWGSKQDKEKIFHYLYDNLNDTFYYKRKYERLKNSLYGNTEVSNQIAKG